jgi:hypothetical protein
MLSGSSGQNFTDREGRPPEGEVFVSALKRLADAGRSLGQCFFYRIYTVLPSGRAARGTVGLLTRPHLTRLGLPDMSTTRALSGGKRIFAKTHWIYEYAVDPA